MPKVKEHCLEVKKSIVREHEDGKGYMKLSKQLNFLASSVKSIIKKWKEQGSATNKPRTDAPKKINLRACSKLVRMVKKNPRMTKKELRRKCHS